MPMPWPIMSINQFGNTRALHLSFITDKTSMTWTETIYVRVYEERMDLLRAVLVGAPGTPYHDGLFFFDILLPPEYPHEPPVSSLCFCTDDYQVILQ